MSASGMSEEEVTSVTSSEKQTANSSMPRHTFLLNFSNLYLSGLSMCLSTMAYL